MSEFEIEGLSVVSGIEKLQEGMLFKGLTFDETRMLAGICGQILRKDGEVIIEENALGQGLYLVVKGEVAVFKGTGPSKKLLAVLGPGEIFGEMSLIEDLLTSSSVVAKGDVQLLHIPERKLEDLMAVNDRFAAKVYKSFCLVLSDRLRKANRKLEGVQKHG